MKSFFVLALVILSSSCFAQSRQEKIFNPLSSKTAIGLEGGITYTKSDFQNTEINYIIRLLGDYYFTTYDNGILGISVAGEYGYAAASGRPGYRVYYPPLEEFRTQLFMLSGGASFTYSYWDSFFPYIIVRAGWVNYQPKDTEGTDLIRNKQNKYSPNDWFASGELGLKFMVSKSISLNFSAIMNYLPFDNLDDSPNTITGGSDNDIFFTFNTGLQFYFGGIEDSDNDGVEDKDDLCPDTPPSVITDEFGCPIDADKDGVPDFLDKCPNTPKNVPVNLDGCSLDRDGDGIPDYLDLCNDTPIGVKVDSRGCPLDSDDDGVPDFKDLCSDTPKGTEVNKWGCPIDEKVYEPIRDTEIILNAGVTFATGKAELLAAAYPELERLLKVMKDYPDTKWKIEGHTDNTGPYDLNKELSLERAHSVYNYFVSRGIDGSRIFMNGYGPDYPIADNNTETGRSQNRRVSIILFSGDNPEVAKNTNVKVKRTYDPANEKNVGSMIFTDGYLYCFQVSSWRSRAKAEGEMKRLQSEGYNSFVTIADLPELDGTWFRVRIGYFDSLEEVNKVKKRFNK